MKRYLGLKERVTIVRQVCQHPVVTMFFGLLRQRHRFMLSDKIKIVLSTFDAATH